jgi:hypothetical protein
MPIWPATWPTRCAKTPHLKVFSLNGLFDLATPFFITEFDLSHMDLEPKGKLRNNMPMRGPVRPPQRTLASNICPAYCWTPAKLRQNIAFAYYGHMIYLNVDALKQLKIDLAEFNSAPRRGRAKGAWWGRRDAPWGPPRALGPVLPQAALG